MTVYLVGAGPGDPGLLTVRGAEVLSRADVVVHDRLADPVLLDQVPAGAERVDVGKSPGGPVDQEAINRLLVERARQGLEVVRLKGGDPFVFGRGGEEAMALMDAGVAFEVVPGITSAVAVPAYAGVPLTHRGLSTSFTVVTGHSRHAPDTDADWESLARAGGTIVVLMGVAHRDQIAQRLIAGGLHPATPVTAISWGTRPEQATVRMTLAELPHADLRPPTTIVIGAVAGLDLAWYERRPLFGRRVVVTRPAGQAPALSAKLRDFGALPVEVPAIRISDPADGGAALAGAAKALVEGAYEWVVFTSANAVERFLGQLRDARSFGSAKIAAIGPGTSRALSSRNLEPDLVPSRHIAEGLLEAFPAPTEGSAILLPRAAGARPVLPLGLEAMGWRVDEVEAYRTVGGRPSAASLEAAAGADAICFTSSSTVTYYLAAGGPVPPVVACIGPVTAATAADAGLRVAVTAAEHSVDGLVDALTAVLGRA